jgi:hypothetical protein
MRAKIGTIPLGAPTTSHAHHWRVDECIECHQGEDGRCGAGDVAASEVEQFAASGLLGNGRCRVVDVADDEFDDFVPVAHQHEDIEQLCG